MSYQIGDIVRLPARWENELGLVYELYEDFDDPTLRGVSIITRGGRDLGGFSASEQVSYLHLVRRTDFRYEFKNVIELGRDYMAGKFTAVFEEAA